MCAKIDINSLKAFAKTLEGKTLKTKSHKKDFIVNVLHNSFEFIPMSSNKSSREPFKNLLKVVDRFTENRSFQPKDFQDITRNSVYILYIIENYLNKM